MKPSSTNPFVKTRARRIAAAALAAAPLAAVLAAGATGTAQAEELPDTAKVPFVPVSVPIEVDDATITLDDTQYTTGALSGKANIVQSDKAAAGLKVQDGALASPVDPAEVGDFGQVRVTGETPADAAPADPAEQQAAGSEEPAGCTFTIEVQDIPGDDTEETATLTSDPVQFALAEEANDPKAFPPVGQLYSLEEPVQLYEQTEAGEIGQAVGTLDGFDVMVNQSEAPAQAPA